MKLNIPKLANIFWITNIYTVGDIRYRTIQGNGQCNALSNTIYLEIQGIRPYKLLDNTRYLAIQDIQQSYIRKGKYCPATPTPTPTLSHSGDPPLTLQRAGLESSGRRLNS